VTSGTQMGAMEVLVSDILCEAGLAKLDIRTRTALELPGYYRPEKKWDLIVVSEKRLVLAMEFKSQVGPSFGNISTTEPKRQSGARRIYGSRTVRGVSAIFPLHSSAISFSSKTARRSRRRSATRSRFSRSIPSSRARRLASATNYSVSVLCWSGSTTRPALSWRRTRLRRSSLNQRRT
jgi:hypothetical protein